MEKRNYFLCLALSTVCFVGNAEEQKDSRVLVSRLLLQYEKFHDQYFKSGMNMNIAKRGTSLEKLSEEDWKYLEGVILTNGFARKDLWRIEQSKITLVTPEKKYEVELKAVFDNTIVIDGVSHKFAYDSELSLEQNDKKLTKIAHELSAPKFSYLDFLFDMLLPQAQAMSTYVGSALRSVSSGVLGVFRGFTSPVGNTASFITNRTSWGNNVRTGEILSYDSESGTGTARDSAGTWNFRKVQHGSNGSALEMVH